MDIVMVDSIKRRRLENFNKTELVNRCVLLEKRLAEYERISVFTDVYEAAFYVVKKEWPSITDEALKSKSRVAEIVAPRHMMMFLLSTVAKQSLSTVGKQLGRRDHTSIIHARNKILDIASYDKRERERMVRCVKTMKMLLLNNHL